MFDGVKAAFKNIDLRKKILFTLFVIFVFRVGCAIPVPFIDATRLSAAFEASGIGSGIGGLLDIMSGGALSQATLFALAIAPYINASIIMQLLCIAIPALERMQKEENGPQKINQITRYVTVGLGLVMSYGYYSLLAYRFDVLKYKTFFTAVVVILAFTAGSAIVMWLAERINEKGIGNGISMILFASILSQGSGIINWLRNAFISKNYVGPILVGIISIGMIVGIVLVNKAERRIPIQYAKRVVGRKMYGGNSTHLPMKVMMTGVMPIIFASSFCMLPQTIATFFASSSSFAVWVEKYFSQDTVAYGIVYFLLIVFFNYFYVSVSYNPVEIANNLQKNGGSVPGIRPGEPTANYLKKTLNKITLFGALFLGVIAILPMIASAIFNLSFTLGGTSILIVVSVIMETAVTIESQIVMRHYRGFLE